jgi:hypothetical protein
METHFFVAKERHSSHAMDASGTRSAARTAIAIETLFSIMAANATACKTACQTPRIGRR